MYYIQYSYQYSHRLQFKVTKTSASTTSFCTHDFDHRYLYSTFTYIARTIRPTLRTLYIMLSLVLLSFDYGSVRDYTVVVRMNPCGSGRFCGISLRSCHGGDINTTLSAAQYFGLMSYSPQHYLSQGTYTVPVPRWSVFFTL